MRSMLLKYLKRATVSTSMRILTTRELSYQYFLS